MASSHQTEDRAAPCPSSGFLQLPVEIRRLIYAEILIKTKVLLPQIRADRATGARSFGLTKNDVHLQPFGRDAHPRYAKTPVPLEDYYLRYPWSAPIGLLGGVCRLVQEEALAVFFLGSGNQFVFPRGMYDPLIYLGTSCERAVSRAQMLLRDVSFGFAYDDALHEPSEYALHSDPAGDRAALGLMDVGNLPPDPRARADMCEAVWEARIVAIKTLRLHRLRLGFHECVDLRTLRRKVDWVLERLLHEWDGPRPRVIEISGWKDADEKAMIEAALMLISGDDDDSDGSIIQFQGDANDEHPGTGFANLEPNYSSNGSVDSSSDSGDGSEVDEAVCEE